MNKTRVELLQQALQQHFSPQYPEISDDSHLHAGHASAGGAGHFRVRIVAQAFTGLTRVQRHQAVFQAVAPLLGTQVHALSIEAKSPQEGISER